MALLSPRGTVLHCDFRPGMAHKRPVVLANSLGTDLRMWSDLIAQLPDEIPVLSWDKRGHGLSGGVASDIATHAADCADLMDAFGLQGALVCGVSVGGMIAQALAASRPDLVAGLVLSNTAPRIGTPEKWASRIDGVTANGLDATADQILEQWFPAEFRRSSPAVVAGYRNMLVSTSTEGYLSVCAAIRDADLTADTRGIGRTTLCVAGSDDGATSASLVREMSELIKGAKYVCLDGVGHLPPIEVPGVFADLLREAYERLA